MDTTIILVIVVVVAVGAAAAVLFCVRFHGRAAVMSTRLEAKRAECEALLRRLNDSGEALRRAGDDVKALNEEKAVLQTENARLHERLRQESEAREGLRKESQLLFGEIAAKILDEKSRTFRESNETRLNEILAPFRENIAALQKTIHDRYAEEVGKVESLKESIRTLTETNTAIDRQARELSMALRGNAKVQGDWGEMILKQILEKSGLQEGVNYTLQATENADGTKIADEQGNRLRPDAVFYLPEGDRSLVIDSKVSLTAYVDYMNAPADEQPRLLQNHIRSVRAHVDELARKEYQKYVANAADFVLMFVPNEPAYLAAMHGDTHLWEDAYARQVVIVSPTHLISVLKLMYQLWTRDKQTKNALRIADETGKLYDKIAGFVADLDNVGRGLRNAGRAYEEAYKKLASGRGNILSRVENIRELGIKTQKRLPASELREAASVDDEPAADAGAAAEDKQDN